MAEDRCDPPLPGPDVAAVYVLAGGFTGTVFVRSDLRFSQQPLRSPPISHEVSLVSEEFHNLQLVEERVFHTLFHTLQYNQYKPRPAQCECV